MKIYILLILIIFISCDLDSSPELNNKKNPFIVTKIKKYKKGFSMYYCEKQRRNTFFNSFTTKLILPSGYFNINDTIKIIKN